MFWYLFNSMWLLIYTKFENLECYLNAHVLSNYQMSLGNEIKCDACFRYEFINSIIHEHEC